MTERLAAAAHDMASHWRPSACVLPRAVGRSLRGYVPTNEALLEAGEVSRVRRMHDCYALGAKVQGSVGAIAWRTRRCQP